MKKIFTLITSSMLFLFTYSQVVLNELYCLPGAGKHEFFEFYNTSVNTTTESMDNYTLVTYYQEPSNKRGFYVLDLPDIPVAPKGFFVGSAALPFNYQGMNNSTNTGFSWNDLAFMAANNAYLRKWELSNVIPEAVDGNEYYDLRPIPANFNDLFVKLGGIGASYCVFIYKNGNLVNAFFGGVGGNSFVPAFIISMPVLKVDMSGSSPDFEIDFSTYGSISAEFVTEEAGTDNGYIRSRDGMCNTWTKSSSGSSHTPQMSNGPQIETTGAVSVAHSIIHGNASSGSTVNYDVVGASSPSVFPVTIEVYLDNGSVGGQIDGGDVFVDSNTEYQVSDGPFSTTFYPFDAHVMLVVKSSAGCIDRIMFSPNTAPLPVKLVSFNAAREENQAKLEWMVAENESAASFEIEHSSDGRVFNRIAEISSSGNKGTDRYYFNYNISANEDHYFRIRISDLNTEAHYSVTRLIKASGQDRAITLLRNPVESYLQFSCHSPESTMGKINIYNSAGSLLYTQQVQLMQGQNTITTNLDGRINAGVYVLEVISVYDKQSARFIKR